MQGHLLAWFSVADSSILTHPKPLYPQLETLEQALAERAVPVDERRAVVQQLTDELMAKRQQLNDAEELVRAREGVSFISGVGAGGCG